MVSFLSDPGQTKDGTSSSSDEDESPRSAGAVIHERQPYPTSSSGSVSLQTAQSITTVTAISREANHSNSRTTVQTCPNSLAPHLSPTTYSNGGGELGISLLPTATTSVESEQLDSVFLDSRPTSQGTSNFASSHQTVTSALAPSGVANSEGDGVDATVRFGNLLSSGPSISCPSNVTSLADGRIHFSLSSLPGNRVASPTQLNSSRQNEAQPLNAVEPSFFHQQRLSVDTRASSLPTLEATARGRNRELHGGPEFQPASSSSLSTLPIRSGPAAGAVDSRKATGSVEHGGQAEVPDLANRHPKESASGEPSSKASKPKSGLRWRNLFGSSSSSSSSWSGSDLDDSGLKDTSVAQKGKTCESNHGAPVVVPAGRATTDSTCLAARDSASRAGPSTGISVAGSSKDKKRKGWLMTRFLRSVVFSDSSSTYSDNSDEDDDDKICSNRRTDGAKGCVKSNSRAQDIKTKHAQTSCSLPNISEALNDRGASQSSVKVSRTFDNIGGSVEIHGVTNNRTQNLSKSTELKHNSTAPAAHTGLAVAKRPSVSSQTEIKEVSASYTGDCRFVGGSSKPEVSSDASHRLIHKRPSVSSQTDPKELSSSREQDRNILADISETREGQSYGCSGEGCVTRETEVKQLPIVTRSCDAQSNTDFDNQGLVCLPRGEESPRTIYDNISPNQNKSQPFSFELQNSHGETNFEAVHNPCATHSRYDNYNSGTSGNQTEDSCLDVNTSEPHQIDTLKESTTNQRARLEINSHQPGFPRQEVISQGQRHSLDANHNRTLYDNVGIEDVQLGLYWPTPSGDVARRVPGTEIEDLKTGLEQHCRHSQQQHLREALHPIAEMENLGSPSVVSSVEEPSLLTSSVAGQELSETAGGMTDLHLVELPQYNESHPPNLSSRLDLDCDSAGPEVSRYDNMNSMLNQGAVSRDVGKSRDEQGVIGEGSPASHNCENQTALGTSISEHGNQAKEEESGAFSVSLGDQVCQAVEARPRSVNISPHMRFSNGQSAPVSSDPAQNTNMGAGVKCPGERNLLGSSIISYTNRTETAQTENNNNDCKSADVGAQHRGAAHEEDCNDDADVEDEDDEENAHSSSAMLKTKKKKPRSKFTKFLTSLLSLSSSSEDEDYCREDAEDSGTTSSKSSDW